MAGGDYTIRVVTARKFSQTDGTMPRHYLTLCCIVKDEDPFLKEWLAYHALLGVEHFYIYDNMSKRPVRDALEGFADPARVTVRRVHGAAMQVPAYNDCLQSFGASCRWMGFIDLDEFLLPMKENDLRVVLSEFEQYGGLGATWHLFNSSGHLKRPAGPVIKNYTEAFAEQTSYAIKCLVQPGKTVEARSPHHFSFHKGQYCVNEDHYPIPPVSHFTFTGGRLLRVNHYFVRSQQDFEQKLIRGRGDSADPKSRHEMAMFLNTLTKPYVTDTEAQRFLPRLEAALLKNRLPHPSPLPPEGISFDALMEMVAGLHSGGLHEKALACTCSPDAAHAERAEFWTLRSLLATAMGDLGRADIFIRESLQRASTEEGIRQLRLLFQARGRMDYVAAIDEVLRTNPEVFP